MTVEPSVSICKLYFGLFCIFQTLGLYASLSSMKDQETKWTASSMGAKGGKSRSAKKVAAARINAKKCHKKK